MVENTTEAANPRSQRLDQFDSLSVVRLMNAEDRQVAVAVEAVVANIAEGIDQIARRLQDGGRLIYLGAGTSGRLGVLDAAECPPTFSCSPAQVRALIAGGDRALCESIEGAEDDGDAAVRDLREIALARSDVCVGIAASGGTPYTLAGIRYAREIGAFAIALCCNSGTAMEAAADLAIVPIVGPEVLAGSTRLKAGSATKMILNMLSTGVMVRLGKVFGNRMVDLRASNAKLRQRSLGMIVEIAGLDREAATEVLHNCRGELKTALVCACKGVGPEKARDMLTTAGGQLRRVL